jgi:hypothetical protein
LIGQTRGELVEDQIEERSIELETGGISIEREKIARVEYTARADMLYPHKVLRLPEFGGLTSSELIEERRRVYLPSEEPGRFR